MAAKTVGILSGLVAEWLRRIQTHKSRVLSVAARDDVTMFYYRFIKVSEYCLDCEVVSEEYGTIGLGHFGSPWSRPVPVAMSIMS